MWGDVCKDSRPARKTTSCELEKYAPSSKPFTAIWWEIALWVLYICPLWSRAVHNTTCAMLRADSEGYRRRRQEKEGRTLCPIKEVVKAVVNDKASRPSRPVSTLTSLTGELGE